MRVRKLGRWVGRLLTVAALGVGATVGVVSSVFADGSAASAEVVTAEPSSDDASPDTTTWE